MKLQKHGDGTYHFRCPGCKDTHRIPVQPPYGWAFNGNVVTPTFSPSILVRTGHFAPGHKAGDHCWCVYNNERKAAGEAACGFVCYVCHSFVKDGQIQFLPDCTHVLAGKTVPMDEVKP